MIILNKTTIQIEHLILINNLIQKIDESKWDAIEIPCYSTSFHRPIYYTFYFTKDMIKIDIYIFTQL